MNFALLIDKKNNHSKIVEGISKLLDIDFHRVSPIYATTIDNINNCIISITPCKIHFMFFNNSNDTNKENVILKIKEYLEQYFNGQIVGVANYESNDKLFNDVSNIDIIYI